MSSAAIPSGSYRGSNPVTPNQVEMNPVKSSSSAAAGDAKPRVVKQIYYDARITPDLVGRFLLIKPKGQPAHYIQSGPAVFWAKNIRK